VPIREARGRLEILNAVKVKPSTQPTNVVPALERTELRAVVTGLSDADRVPFILGTTDAHVVEAVLGALAAVSLPDDFAMVETTYQERAFGPQLTRCGLCVGSASTSKVGRTRPGSFRHLHSGSGYSTRPAYGLNLTHS
jgi:hypothetical protein